MSEDSGEDFGGIDGALDRLIGEMDAAEANMPVGPLSDIVRDYLLGTLKLDQSREVHSLLLKSHGFRRELLEVITELENLHSPETEERFNRSSAETVPDLSRYLGHRLSVRILTLKDTVRETWGEVNAKLRGFLDSVTAVGMIPLGLAGAQAIVRATASPKAPLSAAMCDELIRGRSVEFEAPDQRKMLVRYDALARSLAIIMGPENRAALTATRLMVEHPDGSTVMLAADQSGVVLVPLELATAGAIFSWIEVQSDSGLQEG
jgi:hypothetical protein